MTPPRRSARWLHLGLEFWLPLPLVGLTFWGLTGWFNQRVLSQPPTAVTAIEAPTPEQITLSLTLTVLSIDAEIDQRSRSTEVTVRTAGSALEEMEFKFPVTDFEDVEAAIAQELGLTREVTRSLIRYRID